MASSNSSGGRVVYSGGQVGGNLANIWFPEVFTDDVLTQCTNIKTATTDVKTFITDTINSIQWLLDLISGTSNTFIDDWVNKYLKQLLSGYSEILSYGGSAILIHPFNSKKKYYLSLDPEGLLKTYNANDNFLVAPINFAVDPRNDTSSSGTSGIPEAPQNSEKPNAKASTLLPALSPRQAFSELIDSFSENTPSTPKWGKDSYATGAGFIWMFDSFDLFVSFSSIADQIMKLVNFKEFETLSKNLVELAPTTNTTLWKYSDMFKAESEKYSGTDIWKKTSSDLGIDDSLKKAIEDSTKSLSTDREWITFNLDNITVLKSLQVFVESFVKVIQEVILSSVNDFVEIGKAIIRKINAVIDLIDSILAFIFSLLKLLDQGLGSFYGFTVAKAIGGTATLKSSLLASLDDSLIKDRLDSSWSILAFGAYGGPDFTKLPEILAFPDFTEEWNAYVAKVGLNVKFSRVLTPPSISEIIDNNSTINLYQKDDKVTLSLLNLTASDTNTYYYSYTLTDDSGNSYSVNAPDIFGEKVESRISSKLLRVGKDQSTIKIPEVKNSSNYYDVLTLTISIKNEISYEFPDLSTGGKDWKTTTLNVLNPKYTYDTTKNTFTNSSNNPVNNSDFSTQNSGDRSEYGKKILPSVYIGYAKQRSAIELFNPDSSSSQETSGEQSKTIQPYNISPLYVTPEQLPISFKLDDNNGEFPSINVDDIINTTVVTVATVGGYLTITETGTYKFTYYKSDGTPGTPIIIDIALIPASKLLGLCND